MTVTDLMDLHRAAHGGAERANGVGLPSEPERSYRERRESPGTANPLAEDRRR